MSRRSAAVCTYERILLTTSHTFPDRANDYHSTSPFPSQPTSVVAKTYISFPQPQPILPLLLDLGLEAEHADRISKTYAKSVNTLKMKCDMNSQHTLALLEHDQVLLGKFIKARARIYERALFSWAVQFLTSLSRSAFSVNECSRLPKAIPPPNKYRDAKERQPKYTTPKTTLELCTLNSILPSAASIELNDMMRAMSLGSPADTCCHVQPSKLRPSPCHIKHPRLPSCPPSTLFNTSLRTIPNRELQEIAFLQYATVPAQLGDAASLPQTRRRRKIAALPKRHSSPQYPFMQPHSPPSPAIITPVVGPLNTLRKGQSTASQTSLSSAFVASTARLSESAPLDALHRSYDRPRKTAPLPRRRTASSTEFREPSAAQSTSQLQPSLRVVQVENLYLRRPASRTPSLASLSSDDDSSPPSPSSAGPSTPISTTSDLPIISAPSKSLPTYTANKSKNVGVEIPWSSSRGVKSRNSGFGVQFSFNFGSP